MDKVNLKKLLIEALKEDNVTMSQFNEAVTLIIGSVNKKFDESKKVLSKEVSNILKEAINNLNDEYTTFQSKQIEIEETVLKDKTDKLLLKADKRLKKLEAKTDSVLLRCTQALDIIDKLELKDGEDGIDADEEKIISAVLAKIKIPEINTDTGENIIDKINATSTKSDKNKIDAKHIKNLPPSQIVQYLGGGSATPVTLKTNGATNTSQSVLNLKQGTNITLTSDGNGGVLISSTGGGGGGGTIYDEFGINILGGKNTITTSNKGMYRAKTNGTITGYSINSFEKDTTAPIIGSIEISVLNNGSTIGTAQLISASDTSDTTLAGWTTSFVKDDTFTFNVTSNTACKNILLVIYYNHA